MPDGVVNLSTKLPPIVRARPESPTPSRIAPANFSSNSGGISVPKTVQKPSEIA